MATKSLKPNAASTNWLDAIRFWERGRIIYNLVLFALVIYFWGSEILASNVNEWWGAFVVLGLFATLANILYCTAYVAEYVYSKTGDPTQVTLFRWAVFGVGTLSAVGIEIWICCRQGMG